MSERSSRRSAPPPAPSARRPALRPGVSIEKVEDSWRIVDSATGHTLALDELQVAIVEALEAGRTPPEIAADVLGDPAEAPSVAGFLEVLADFGLLDQGLDAETLRQRQARALERRAALRRDELVARMVRWAAANIPFYRERIGPAAERVAGVADLGRLPTMTKRDVRENFPARLLPDGVDVADVVARGEAVLQTSSGTTGERLQSLCDVERHGYPRSFPGVGPVEGGWRGVRIAKFTSPICSGLVCHMGVMSYEDRLQNGGIQLVLNSSDRVMRLTRAELADVVADLERFRPTVLRADPVYAVCLVRALQREHLKLPEVAAIWTAEEYCSVLFRQILEETLGATVFTVYGASDIGSATAAIRCENGKYHVREAQFVFEFVRQGRAAEPGEVAEILVTSTRNRFMPVVRYRVGDLGRSLGRPCGCAHRHWPAFDLEGRIRDCLLDTRGGLVTTRAFDDLFEGLRWLDFYQVKQVAAREYEMLCVPRPDGDAADAARFHERARALLGADATLRLRMVRELPAEKSLKYRLTQSELWSPPEEW